MFIPKTVGSKWNHDVCLCGEQEQCLAITKQFQEIDDFHGRYQKVSNPFDDSRKGNAKTMSDH